MRKKTKIIIFTILIVLFIVLIIVSIQTYRNYTILKNHREYFNQPNPQIQDWMTINTLKEFYNISNDEMCMNLKINDTLSNNKMTIKKICQKNKLNCTEVMAELNSCIRK